MEEVIVIWFRRLLQWFKPLMCLSFVDKKNKGVLVFFDQLVFRIV